MRHSVEGLPATWVPSDQLPSGQDLMRPMPPSLPPAPPTAAEVRVQAALDYLLRPDQAARIGEILLPHLLEVAPLVNRQDAVTQAAEIREVQRFHGGSVVVSLPYLLRDGSLRARKACRAEAVEQEKAALERAQRYAAANEHRPYPSAASAAFLAERYAQIDRETAETLATPPDWQFEGGHWLDRATGLKVYGDTCEAQLDVALDDGTLAERIDTIAESARSWRLEVLVTECGLPQKALDLLAERSVIHLRLGDGWQRFLQERRPEPDVIASEMI